MSRSGRARGATASVCGTVRQVKVLAGARVAAGLDLIWCPAGFTARLAQPRQHFRLPTINAGVRRAVEQPVSAAPELDLRVDLHKSSKMPPSARARTCRARGF